MELGEANCSRLCLVLSTARCGKLPPREDDSFDSVLVINRRLIPWAFLSQRNEQKYPSAVLVEMYLWCFHGHIKTSSLNSHHERTIGEDIAMDPRYFSSLITACFAVVDSRLCSGLPDAGHC